MRGVDHAVIRVVAHDGRATQALQNADLDLLRSQTHKTVKAATKALDPLPRQADDEIGVDVNAGFLPQEKEIGLQAVQVLSATDVFRCGVVKGLDTHLELHRP